MRVLFLTESYYPNPSPNAICVKKVINVLSLKGIENILITLKNSLSQPSKEYIDNIPVYRIKNNFGTRLIYYCQSKNWGQKHLIFRLVLLLNKLNGVLLGFWWPLLAPFSVLRYYKVAKKIHKEGRVDVVIGVYKQIEAVLAGVLLKKKYPEIKFIVYTLDAISGSILPRVLRSEKITLKSTKRWERLFFKYADSICVMESHKEHYSQNEYDIYRSKIKYMDIPLVDVNYNKDISIKNGEEYSLVFTGSMGAATADPHYFLKLLKLPQLENIPLKFNIYGNLSCEIEDNIRKSGLLNDKIFLLGSVSHSEIKNIQNQATVLINFGNSYPCAIPSKIFEYISTQKPIISFYKIDEDAGLPYFKKYPNVLLIKEDEFLLDENATRLKRFLENNVNVKVTFDLGEIYYTNTPANMAREILEEY